MISHMSAYMTLLSDMQAAVVRCGRNWRPRPFHARPVSGMEPQARFQTMWGLINDEHVQRGWGQMKRDAVLSNAAVKHCTDMAHSPEVGLSHTGSGGSTLRSRIQAAGGTEFKDVAELIHKIVGKPAVGDHYQVVRHWMESPVDRSIILNPKLKCIGEGTCVNAGELFFVVLMASK